MLAVEIDRGQDRCLCKGEAAWLTAPWCIKTVSASWVCNATVLFWNVTLERLCLVQCKQPKTKQHMSVWGLYYTRSYVKFLACVQQFQAFLLQMFTSHNGVSLQVKYMSHCVGLKAVNYAVLHISNLPQGSHGSLKTNKLQSMKLKG